ncbi:ABC transporter substrate-binding protein [Paenibacillus hodogayensis]|uniref:ABC transporter substrate-binding protein n=1 Tax=Paenibacillus hodogayensis TaxID=279208 RepID=A0ABV5W348_9BACL
MLALSGLLLSASLALAGCGSAADSKAGAPASGGTPAAAGTDKQAAAAPRTLKDALGNQVQIPAQPKRIIAPFLEDPLTALGIKPVAQWSMQGNPQQYLQNELKGIPSLNMTGGMKPEETLSYTPDLIIFPDASYLKGGAYENFAKIAPTFVLSTDTKDWRGLVVKLGEVLGKKNEAEQALQKHDRKLADAKEKLRSTVGEKTAVLLQGSNEKNFKLFGPEFYGGAVLYQGLGFKQPKVLKGDYETYSLETLAEMQDVDYIFVLSGPGRAKPPEDNSLWKNLPAVKQGHVFEADSGHWFNQNVIANGLIVEDVLRYVAK